MMYDFYIDDTEKGDIKHSGYLPMLGGYIIKKELYDNFLKNIYSIKENFGLNRFSPIKWSPGQNDTTYKDQRNLSNQNAFRELILKEIIKYEISIVISIVDTQLLHKKFSFEYYRCQALEYLVQRFQMFLQWDCGIKKQNSGQVILDYPGDKIESLICKHYREVCCKGCTQLDMQVPLLSKTLYFSHAFTCEGLQIADFIVGAIGYTIKHKDKKYFNLIKNRIRNLNNNMKGTGIIIFPSNSQNIDFLFK